MRFKCHARVAGSGDPVPERRLLSDEEIAAKLASVPKWTRVGDRIERTWRFDDFPPAIAFINEVATLAEEIDHHPDIHNSWSKVTLSLTTHDVGGLTEMDFALAAKIDALG